MTMVNTKSYEIPPTNKTEEERVLHSTNALTGDQYMNVTTDFGGGGNGVQGGRSHDLVVVFSDYQDSHD